MHARTTVVSESFAVRRETGREQTIAAWTRRLVGAVLGPEALQARPRLDERTVDREMVARQQRPHLAVSKDGGHELRRHLGIEQPVSVLREDGRVPDGIVDAEPDARL